MVKKTREITIFFSSCLLIFITFSVDLFASTNQPIIYPRTLSQYEAKSINTVKIMVVGTCAGYRYYPENYFLVNNKEFKNVKPDLEHDITTPFSSELNGKFDVVVFECLPVFALTQEAFKNASKVLRSGGKILMNNPGKTSNLSALEGNHKGLVDLGDNFSYLPEARQPYFVYISTNNENDPIIKTKGYQKIMGIVEQNFNSYFKDFKMISGPIHSSWYKSNIPEGGLIEATKK